MSMVESHMEEVVQEIDYSVVEDREYQGRVIGNVLEAVDAGHKSILIEAPTGAGKTVMVHRIIDELLNKFGWTRYGWTVMRRALVSQARDEMLAKFSHLSPHGTYFSSYTSDLDSLIGTHIIVEDEAQHSASMTATGLIHKVQPEIHIGMTATPFRTDRMKLAFSKTVRDAGIRQLVDEGWLSPFHHYVTSITSWTPEEVAALYLSEPERWGKTVIFFLRQVDAIKCARILNDHGIASAPVLGGSIKSQETAIQAFKNNELRVLTNVQVLTEGFNDRSLKTVMIRPGSRGPVIQMAGRALRTYPGKKFAQIVQPMRGFSFLKEASCARRYIEQQDTGKPFTWDCVESHAEDMEAVGFQMLHTLLKTEDAEPPKFLKNFQRKQNRNRSSWRNSF